MPTNEKLSNNSYAGARRMKIYIFINVDEDKNSCKTWRTTLECGLPLC